MGKSLPGRQCFTAMPENRFLYAAGAAIMQILLAAVDLPHQTDSPQRRGTPFATAGSKVWTPVSQFRPHVVQQQVGVRPDTLVTQMWLCTTGRRGIARLMASGTAAGVKKGSSFPDIGIINIPACGNTQIASEIRDQAQKIIR